MIENQGRIVSKDEILRVVWEDVAVTDDALTRAVAQIRKALDDDPKTPRYSRRSPLSVIDSSPHWKPLVRRLRRPFRNRQL